MQAIRSRPDTDNWKMVHLIPQGCKCLMRSKKLAKQAKWSYQQSLGTQDSHIYLDRQRTLLQRSKELRTRANAYFKQANC